MNNRKWEIWDGPEQFADKKLNFNREYWLFTEIKPKMHWFFSMRTQIELRLS